MQPPKSRVQPSNAPCQRVECFGCQPPVTGVIRDSKSSKWLRKGQKTLNVVRQMVFVALKSSGADPSPSHRDSGCGAPFDFAAARDVKSRGRDFSWVSKFFLVWERNGVVWPKHIVLRRRGRLRSTIVLDSVGMTGVEDVVQRRRGRLYRFTDTVEIKEKQKFPHSYSRAEENARFANGVRDDETKKDYINPEIGLVFKVCRKDTDTPSHEIECRVSSTGRGRVVCLSDPTPT